MVRSGTIPGNLQHLACGIHKYKYAIVIVDIIKADEAHHIPLVQAAHIVQHQIVFVRFDPQLTWLP